MKHIVIESGDCLGKGTLIQGLLKHFNYSNVTIRHFGKPPKVFPNNLNALQFQLECFNKEADLVHYIKQLENDVFGYYENTIIWDRSHLGEFVYGQMFRGDDPNILEKCIYNYEVSNLLNYYDETFLILLTSESEFFLKQEDGDSFSQDLKDKERELKLFKKVFDLSVIENKLMIKVDDNGNYRPKENILSEVLEFINTNYYEK